MPDGSCVLCFCFRCVVNVHNVSVAQRFGQLCDEKEITKLYSNGDMKTQTIATTYGNVINIKDNTSRMFIFTR